MDLDNEMSVIMEDKDKSEAEIHEITYENSCNINFCIQKLND